MTGTELEITADLVRDLLREQHPDLAGLTIREVAGGWGNQMWRLGDELAVRMQRMDPTPDVQLKERRWLPALVPHLPLPVPTPVRFGEPSERFPKHWTVMTWVPGEPLDHATISRGAHAADTLAAFLRALHVPAPAEAPIATDRGAGRRSATRPSRRAESAPGTAASAISTGWGRPSKVLSPLCSTARLRTSRAASHHSTGDFPVVLEGDTVLSARSSVRPSRRGFARRASPASATSGRTRRPRAACYPYTRSSLS